MGDLSKLRFGLAAPPTEIEYGFCDGSPEPASIDNISVEPFPILVQNGASVTLAVQANKRKKEKKRKKTWQTKKIRKLEEKNLLVQITLNEPLPAGASVS